MIFSNFRILYSYLKDYSKGFDIGAIMPCFIRIRGFVASWKVSLVVHSGPTGKRRDLSYCCRVSKGCGRLDARYLPFCVSLADIILGPDLI